MDQFSRESGQHEGGVELVEKVTFKGQFSVPMGKRWQRPFRKAEKARA